MNTALNSGKKQKPMTAMELVTSLSVNELAEVSTEPQVCAAINKTQGKMKMMLPVPLLSRSRRRFRF